MCGIFGYVGKQLSLETLVEGLQRLEYRGYDSCGIAALREKKLFLQKRSGKIAHLRKQLDSKLKSKTELAILHTRWATHGKPNKINAHPHIGCRRKIVAVHNGIIENFLPLKEKLKKQGHRFTSETDTEIIVHLIEEYYKGSLAEAVKKAITKLDGSFAVGVFCVEDPDTLLVARKASPLIVGLGKEGNFIASDIPALLSFTKKVIYLKDGELAVLKKDSFFITFFSTKFLPELFKNNPFGYFWQFVLYCSEGRVKSPIDYTKYMSCFVFKKNNPKIVHQGKDIFVDTPGKMVEPDEGYIDHPTPKPKHFIKEILKMFTKENDLVLDPFIGSGSTAVACIQLNRKFIGFEIEKIF